MPRVAEPDDVPVRDAYHEVVKRALLSDGWTITHDPFTLSVGGRHVFVDLGAERLLAAEKGAQRIAVEVKAFPGPSDLADLQQALGQYVLYRSLLMRIEPDRQLFLAVPELIFESTLLEPIAQPVLQDLKLHVVTFDPRKEQIVRWMP